MQLFGGTAVVGDGNINLNDRQSEDWKERIRNLGGCVFFQDQISFNNKKD